MKEKGICLNLHYIPVHTQPYYENLGFKGGDFPNSEKYYEEAFTLPLYYSLTDEQQDHIVKVQLRYCNEWRNSYYNCTRRQQAYSKKNIKEFCGKPIIAYSIEAAFASKIFTEVMVSTDDPEIADIAIQYGAKVPFLRSNETSDDFRLPEMYQMK